MTTTTRHRNREIFPIFEIIRVWELGPGTFQIVRKKSPKESREVYCCIDRGRICQPLIRFKCIYFKIGPRLIGTVLYATAQLPIQIRRRQSPGQSVCLADNVCLCVFYCISKTNVQSTYFRRYWKLQKAHIFRSE